MNIAEYLVAVRHRWRVLAVCLVLAAAVAALGTWRTPPTYTVTTQSFVTVGSAEADTGGVYQESQFTVQRVKSYAQLVSSPLVLQPVIDELALEDSPQSLGRRVKATSPLNTVLLEVTVRDGNPQRAVQIADAVSLQLGQVVEELEALRDGSSKVAISLTGPAVEPSSPTSPQLPLNLAVGLALGLGLGLALAVLRERLDTTVRGRADIAEAASIPFLGSVSDSKTVAERPVVPGSGPPAVLEQFRTVRTNLQLIDIDSTIASVVVTSATPSSGKTTTACNLAVAIAQAGSRVCLVDADLRRPSAARYLGIDPSVGITDVILGDVSLEDAVQRWELGSLSVLPAGRCPPDAGSVLASDRFARLLEQLQEQFDVVVYDAPSLRLVADAVLVAQRTDCAILAVRYGRARRADVAEAVHELQLARVGMIGAVLTFAPGGGEAPYGSETDPWQDPGRRRAAWLGRLRGSGRHRRAGATRFPAEDRSGRADAARPGPRVGAG